MAAEGASNDNTWLVDMVVQFMRSPTWKKPLNDFIGEKCTMFDNFQEENKHEYVEVHQEFKTLVDDLLAAHLLELDISPEVFEQQCLESNLIDDPRMKQIVDKLAAADNFLSFKQMMIDAHTNKQLQAEATLQDENAAHAAAVAAAAEEEEEELARRVAAMSAAAPQDAAPSTAPSGSIVPQPTAAEERSFGAGGGFYGRAQMGAAKKPASNEKASAIRQALFQACRPK
eukprot:TRINITY_DN52410_c0_g1_i1.p1 TRINITY_DN52410_c0_g1~~TRINITY_DN52410_c0_g1_i1.p1  ORF type:complete len:254 (-),score=74.77 TRINITY_DN52410_c0_g1_i1:63-749(-)